MFRRNTFENSIRTLIGICGSQVFRALAQQLSLVPLMRRWLPILCVLPVASACASGPSKSDLDDEVRRLCAIDGGIKVYETVRLPADRFDQWGNVRIPSKDSATSSDEYFYVSETLVLQPGNPQMNRTTYKIIRRNDGKVLGTSVRYGRGGGDLLGPWHPSSFSCPTISRDVPSIQSSVFTKAQEQRLNLIQEFK